VETIGDAYMVSSGIPVRIPDHASELADMALTLCNGVTRFKVIKRSLFRVNDMQIMPGVVCFLLNC